MSQESQIAVYISLGSFGVSLVSLFYTIRQAKINKKSERARVYDKVYHNASDLLLYHYKNSMESKFKCDDKDLERAVNEYSVAHWIEQMYGFNFHVPDSLESDESKREFCQKVRDTYYAHEQEKQTKWIDEFINYQSPVFHLENEDFQKRFSYLMSHVTENLSFFSPAIKRCWEDMRLKTPEKVKSEYFALKRVNQNACEIIDERIDDPYLQLLLSIRYEYREMHKSYRDKIVDYWYRVLSLKHKTKAREFIKTIIYRRHSPPLLTFSLPFQRKVYKILTGCYNHQSTPPNYRHQLRRFSEGAFHTRNTRTHSPPIEERESCIYDLNFLPLYLDASGVN